MAITMIHANDRLFIMQTKTAPKLSLRGPFSSLAMLSPVASRAALLIVLFCTSFLAERETKF